VKPAVKYAACPHCAGEGVDPRWDTSEECGCPSYAHREYIGAPLEVEVVHTDDCPSRCELCGGCGGVSAEEAAEWISDQKGNEAPAATDAPLDAA
jgi:hypothetical protein